MRCVSSVREYVWLAAVVAIFAVGVCAFAMHIASSLVRDAYASDWTAEFLLDHLKTNRNHWPRGWEELSDEHAACYPNPCPFSLDEIRARVEMRFDVNADAISTSEPALIFLRLKSGSRANYGGDPNERIREYLATQVVIENAALK